jgi:NAD+ kinase
VIDAAGRPVSATADNLEVRNVVAVEIVEDTMELTMLFDEGVALGERVLREQFSV